VDVPATNVTGPSVVCRLTEEDPPNEVLTWVPYSWTTTDIKCSLNETSYAGYYDLSLSNDGSTFGSSVP
jgi:hypothetical protein